MRRLLPLLLLLGLSSQLGGCLITAGIIIYKHNQNKKNAPVATTPTNNTATTTPPPTNTPTNTGGKLKPTYPRVLISIPEFRMKESKRAPDPSAETEFTKLFIQQGFKIIDKKQGEKVWKDDVVYKLEKEEDLSAAAALAFKLGAEVVIIGQATTETAAAVGSAAIAKVYNINARVEVKAIRADTAEVIWADSQTSRATDSTELLANQKALAKAGQELAGRIAGKITSLPQKGTSIEVVLAYPGGKLTFAEVKKFKEGLVKVEGVKEIIDREFNSGAAMLEVVFYGSANDLASAIDSKIIGERSCTIEKVTNAKLFVNLK